MVCDWGGVLMASKYATFKPDRTLALRLIKGLHTIPEDAVSVDEELWVRLIQETDGVWTLGKDGTISKVNHAPPTPEEIAQQLTLTIANTRYEREIGGIVVQGMSISTDDRSKALIASAALQGMRNPEHVLKWKTTNGFVDISGSQLLAVADAVNEHVQACFAREHELLTALNAGEFTEAMLGEGWPL